MRNLPWITSVAPSLRMKTNQRSWKIFMQCFWNDKLLEGFNPSPQTLAISGLDQSKCTKDNLYSSQYDCRDKSNLNKIFFLSYGGWKGYHPYSPKFFLTQMCWRVPKGSESFSLLQSKRSLDSKYFTIYIRFRNLELDSHPGMWHECLTGFAWKSGKVLRFRRIHRDPQMRKQTVSVKK